MRYAKLVILLFGVPLVSCQQAQQNREKGTASLVEVTTTGMNFQGPDEINAGWHTFRYHNNSTETNFILFEKMPEGIRIENYRNELLPPFLKSFQYLDSGNTIAAMQEFGKFPKWFGKIEFKGGVGLTSPKRTVESTLYLEPGVYILECYLRNPDGIAHAFVGMTKELVVVEKKNDYEPGNADYEISISLDGISFVESLTPGEYTFSVEFEDQRKYSTLLGHDVNLVKLDDPAALDSLGYWINAENLKAFRNPAPEGLTFLGGIQDLPKGEIGYFNVSLEEGEYVLISEIPRALERNMYTRFTVSEENTQ